MNRISNYIICATARSGSNLLCELLASLVFAGKPFEHLWDPPGSTSQLLAVRWPRILDEARGENGVFGTKLLWYQADRLERELPAALGQPDRSLIDVLAEAIGNPRYTYLKRRDHVRRAVSFARAIQTEQWRSMDRVASQPQYDAGAISAAIHALEQEEANWEAFFTRADIRPHRLTYEDLDSSPREAIGDLMRFLGYQGLLPNSLAGSRHQRQADDVTENWVRRYEKEEHP